MNRSSIAVEAFERGYNCAQSVVEAYRDESGLDPDTAWKVAAGFGGGLGRSAETCGAVSGAVIVIGLYCKESDPGSAKARTYEKVKLFVERFKGLHCSVACGDILGEDISTEEGLKRVYERGLFDSRYKEIVREAVKILEGLV